MTFFIPPVFLFGNNANRVPHDEEKKSEYKTAAETEIKVENWRVKRIAELEEENRKWKERVEELEGERMRDGLLGQATMEEAYNRIIELEEENKKLREENEELQEYKSMYEGLCK